MDNRNLQGSTQPNTNQKDKKDDEEQIKIRSYKYRWIILALYGVTMASNGNIICCLYNITDVVCKYYDVSKSTLLLASSIGNAATVIALIPATFIPSRYGLRVAMVIGSGVLAIGASIFVGATTRNGYHWFVISQTLFGIATGILFQLCTDISAVWFPTHQHTLATSINLQMQNIGVGISYLLTMFLFNDADTMSEDMFETRLKALMYSQSGLCVIVFLLNLFFYRDLPKLPPSISQSKRSGPGEISFSQSIQSFIILAKNWKFLVLATVFGLNYSFGYTYPLINNSLITPNYKNGEKLVSIIGALVVVCSCLGTVLFSLILDKTHKYKIQVILQLTVALFLLVLFSEFLINIYPFYVVCFTIVACWFFFFSTLSILAEVIIEVTYPVNNSTSLVVCIVWGSLLGIALTQLSGWFADNNNENMICWILIGTVGIQIILVFGINIDKKRTALDSCMTIDDTQSSLSP